MFLHATGNRARFERISVVCMHAFPTSRVRCMRTMHFVHLPIPYIHADMHACTCAMHAHCARMHSVQAHYAHDSSHTCIVIPIDVSRCFGTYIPTWMCLRICIFRSVYAVVIYVACKRLHVSIHSHMYVPTCMCLGIYKSRPVYVAVLYCAR